VTTEAADSAAMARFDVIEDEGTRYVRIGLEGCTVRAESGALSYMRGAIEMNTPLPGPGQAIRNVLAGESVLRPSYTGTGEIFLAPTLGGYHLLELAGEAWILESGAYWASDGSVELGLHREAVLTSLWAGEGLIDFQTRVGGRGRVVVNTSGTIAEIELHGERIAVEGKQVIARTEGLDYTIRRPSRSLLGSWLSGEGLVRVYRGTGRVLLTTAPFWNRRLLAAVER
jgi:uncharacterized protein (AIM24 family)